MVKTLPEIIAHRGSTYLAPENTLSAFRNAIDLGADGVEMDVQQTRDHGLIIHHDYLIDIGTELSAKIYDLTVGELRSIDLTKWNGVSLTTERLATLDEALACCKEMEGCTVQLELKAPILPDPDFVPHVVDCIREKTMQALHQTDEFVESLLTPEENAELLRLLNKLRKGL